ncbi:Hypothetical Protein SLY_1054 [Strawberry lethal yellows phytoplasma (CPA) str. NZSb11]|uniref:Uncharacterized protein n=1 Tax=Strawberry lethal yellows phytoplasma (CPA) str. NZSb11 TaxID=980422 RepID=R4S2F1_PHYAS|nr:Hypothetical Protein SLY_1054 [Strawberry lethal yellows phytoplasma (CPA) str. NZSb11]
MADPAGFEPANHGVKVRCLTTWLWALVLSFLYYWGG